jgi:hypothetical protein
VYVSVLGNERLTVFPPRELFFEKVPANKPKIATYRAKWDEKYRARWGIDSGPAQSIPPEKSEELQDLCKKIYRLLELKGYGRIDLRIRDDGRIYFLEANPNPSIARDDEFALSAKKGGLKYTSLIEKNRRARGLGFRGPFLGGHPGKLPEVFACRAANHLHLITPSRSRFNLPARSMSLDSGFIFVLDLFHPDSTGSPRGSLLCDE